MIKIVAFDVFGTLLDMSGVDPDELRAYGNHIKQREWKPLDLPESWTDLDVFPDVPRGLGRVAAYVIPVTLSNAPIPFQIKLWRKFVDCGLFLSYYVPLELRRVFKPNPLAYEALLDLFPQHKPYEFLMVSGNAKFGDIEAAQELGMEALLIRGTTGRDMHDVVDRVRE